jgi:hypothetical protein
VTEASSCIVCLEPATAATASLCGGCGEHFHLNPRSDVPGKDCGQVWISEEHLGLEFACNTCLNPPPADLDDILDLEEAAAAAGLPVEMLRASADAGRIPHRKTKGGTYLFTRRDLESPRR